MTSLTSKPYILGTYRQHATVIVGEHSATVRNLSNGEPPRYERYGVYDDDGDIQAVCWRYGVPHAHEMHYDGGWQRAVALAEQLATEAHNSAVANGLTDNMEG